MMLQTESDFRDSSLLTLPFSLSAITSRRVPTIEHFPILWVLESFIRGQALLGNYAVLTAFVVYLKTVCEGICNYEFKG
jgi:hypothetical protein